MPVKNPLLPSSPGKVVRVAKILSRVVVALLLVSASVFSLADNHAPVTFSTRRICIATERSVTYLTVDVARSPQQRAIGLMGRKRLATNTGMLFEYPTKQPADTGYWMYLTRIPLDIAFLGADGTILAISSMDPCTAADQHDCPTYLADIEFHYALEVNKGFFASHFIHVGDRVHLSDGQSCL